MGVAKRIRQLIRTLLLLITATLVAAFLSYTVFPHLSSRRSIPPQVDQRVQAILKEAQANRQSIYLARVVSVSSSAKRVRIPLQIDGKSGWAYAMVSHNKCLIRIIASLYGSQRSAPLFLEDHNPFAEKNGGYSGHHRDIAEGMKKDQYWVLVCDKEALDSDVFNTADSPIFEQSFAVSGPNAPEVQALRNQSLPLGLGRLIN